MGVMSFLLPSGLSAEALRELQRACVAGGPDAMPWPTRADVNPISKFRPSVASDITHFKSMQASLTRVELKISFFQFDVIDGAPAVQNHIGDQINR